MTDSDAVPVSIDTSEFRLRSVSDDLVVYESAADPRFTAVIRIWRKASASPAPPRPPDPGKPMVVERQRPIMVAGTERTLLWTSVFDGVAQRVAVIMLPLPWAHVRIVMSGMDDRAVETVAASIRVVEP